MIAIISNVIIVRKKILPKREERAQAIGFAIIPEPE